MTTLTKEQQIERIKLIMGHASMKTCLDCGKVYMPMNKVTNHLCPFCEEDKITNFDQDDKIMEVVSFDAIEF